MNIFFLDNDIKKCAQYHCDKHVVKMILETAQLLSTAHRILDGTETVAVSDTGRKKKKWILPNALENYIYSATHINHPSAIWCRKTDKNYCWLHQLLLALCKEYTYRYGKIHKCQATGLVASLAKLPKNIPIGEFTPPTPAMPDEYKVSNDVLKSYHNYYNGAKVRMFAWKKRQPPNWIITN